MSTGYTLITLKRLDTTEQGVFGHLEWDNFDCVTLENNETLIKEGIYKVKVDMSPRLKYLCPHIAVPERDIKAGGDAGLRIHIANYESQIIGCVAVGENRNGFAIEHSRDTFNQMMSKWPLGEVEIRIV